MTISLEKSSQRSATLQRRDATWQDYLDVRDSALDWRKIAFHESWLFVDRLPEGLAHACFSDLMTMVFVVWALLHPETAVESCGRCLIENPGTHACNPDLILYKGDDIPQWQPGDSQWIDLSRYRLPDLVGEIGDTSLNLDLDEQKRLYASLGIAEYWVIDVKGTRLFAFGLGENGIYDTIDTSQVLTDLPIALLEQTLDRLATGTNTAAANWLMQQLRSAQSQPGT